MRVLLHFGLAKTGTTAIQNALFAHKDYLLKTQQTLFPGQYSNHYFLQAMFSDEPEKLRPLELLGLTDRRAAVDFLKAYCDDLLAEIAAAKPRLVILSSEYFPAMSATEMESLRRFIASFAKDVSLFAYVRDPWSFSISMLQEMARNGQVTDAFEIGYMNSNVEILAQFETAFESKPLVAPYLPGNGDIVADFCRRTDIYLPQAATTRNPMNPGMSKEAMVMMLHLIRIYPMYKTSGEYIQNGARDWMIEALQESPRAKTPIQLSKKSADRIYELAKADLQVLEERFFGGEKIFTEYYRNKRFDDVDDTLFLSTLPPKLLAEYLLSCMKVLADRALTYYYELTEHRVTERANLLEQIENLRTENLKLRAMADAYPNKDR
jgi:hypothetical protein